jgi:hypothetical protein
MPEPAYCEQFRETLQAVARLSHQHPNYHFELIQEFAHQLRESSQPERLIQDWVSQLEALSEARQEAGLRIFEQALLRAQQDTYQPINRIDLFIEQQLYGIQDPQVVENATVSQLLKSQAEPTRKLPARSSQPTHPLNPRNLATGQPPGRQP